MAKGFESKAVEEQQAQHDTGSAAASSALRAKTTAHGVKERERQSLELQKERILDERTSSPHRRAALAAALEEIEGRIAAL
jgi:hypothetical protein